MKYASPRSQVHCRSYERYVYVNRRVQKESVELDQKKFVRVSQYWQCFSQANVPVRTNSGVNAWRSRFSYFLKNEVNATKIV